MRKTIENLIKKWINAGYSDDEIIKYAPTTYTPDEILYTCSMIRKKGKSSIKQPRRERGGK